MSNETWRVPRSGGYRGPLRTVRRKDTRDTCPYCGRPVTRTTDGGLRSHGPCDNRCEGSGRVA